MTETGTVGIAGVGMAVPSLSGRSPEIQSVAMIVGKNGGVTVAVRNIVGGVSDMIIKVLLDTMLMGTAAERSTIGMAVRTGSG